MTEKKYAIVRVDNCPSKFKKGFNDYFVCDGRGKDMRLGADKINCKNCRYGDTKEQMVKKVAQVLFEAKLEIYKNVYGIIPNDKFMKDIYAKQLKVAKKIVEFLGVKCRICFDDNGNRINKDGSLQEPDKPAQESESAKHL